MTLPSPETPESPERSGLRLLRLLAFGFSVLILAAVAMPALGGAVLFGPGPLAEGKTIIVAHGSTAGDIGAQLAKEDVVYLPIAFRIAARIVGSLKAGEYAFPARISAFDAALTMHEGRSVVRLFTAAEGLTSAEIADSLNGDPVLTGTIEKIPPEGSLLPETYRYSYGDSRDGMIARMQKAMQEKVNEIWAGRENDLPLKSAGEAVVLASIVEKETGKPEERPRIAGVFYNRLRQNMRLQSDPTVIYAITKGQKALDRALTHDDLSYPSPLNTYMSDGIPPEAICNPGRAALEAVLHPEHNAFLYFVADGSGGHVFAADLATHDKNINKWHRAIENAAAPR
jgi:UPF0755 protein